MTNDQDDQADNAPWQEGNLFEGLPWRERDDDDHPLLQLLNERFQELARRLQDVVAGQPQDVFDKLYPILDGKLDEIKAELVAIVGRHVEETRLVLAAQVEVSEALAAQLAELRARVVALETTLGGAVLMAVLAALAGQPAG